MGDMSLSNYSGNARSLPGTTTMQTEPLARDVEKRARYRKFLKVRTMVFGALALCFVVVGAPMAALCRGV